MGLLDGRRDGEGEAAGGEFIEELKRLYLDSRQRGVALCFAMAVDKAEKGGWVTSLQRREGRKEKEYMKVKARLVDGRLREDADGR